MRGVGAAVAAILIGTGSASAEPAAITARSPGSTEPIAVAGGNVFAIGTRFAAPGGTCRIDLGPPAAEVTALIAGPITLECTTPPTLTTKVSDTGDKQQTQTTRLPVIIAPVRVAGPIAAIPAGVSRRIHLTVVSVASLGPDLQVHGEGVEVGELQRTKYGVDVTIRIAPTTAKSARVAVHAGGVELGTVDLAIADDPEPPPTRRVSAWFALDLGGFAGGFIPPTTSALGNPRDPAEALTWGPLVGGRLGLFPTRRVGLELETALAMTGHVQRPGTSAVAIGRLQLATRVLEQRHVGLRALAGFDLLGVLDEPDASTGVHYGAALTVETRHDLWLRVQLVDVVTSARNGGYAHCVDLQVGVVTRLGRRDRW